MKNSKNIVFIILIIIFLVVFIYGSYRVLNWKKDNNKTEEIKEEINDYIETVVTENEPKYSVDFYGLKNKNSDTVAYIKIENTNIDYVVVQSDDNDYYLKHNFDNQYSSAGWIFADYHNKFDGTDKNIVIYGHSMLNGSMFGTLKKTLNKKWYSNTDNRIITFVTEDGDHLYEVFSVYNIKAETYYINTEFNNDDEYYSFLNTIKNRSIFDFDVDLDINSQIITLSTCSSGASNRTVLHAKKIK